MRTFFKPTIGKILLTFVLAFLPLYSRTVCPFVPPCFTMRNYAYEFMFHGTLDIFDWLNRMPYALSQILSLIITLLVFYVIASALVWAFMKIVRRKKKRAPSK